MNKRTKIVSAFLVASSIALAVPLAAQARPDGDGAFAGGCGARGEMMKHGGRHGGERGPGMMRELNLTEAQQDKMFELRYAMAPKMREEMKAIRAASESLRDMADKGEYDEAKVKSLTETRAQAMSRMAQLRAKNQHEVYQLLTAEQRDQWQKLKTQRPMPRPPMGGMMPDGPDQGMDS